MNQVRINVVTRGQKPQRKDLIEVSLWGSRTLHRVESCKEVWEFDPSDYKTIDDLEKAIGEKVIWCLEYRVGRY